jgi:hypothetical protein
VDWDSSTLCPPDFQHAKPPLRYFHIPLSSSSSIINHHLRQPHSRCLCASRRCPSSLLSVFPPSSVVPRLFSSHYLETCGQIYFSCPASPFSLSSKHGRGHQLLSIEAWRLFKVSMPCLGDKLSVCDQNYFCSPIFPCSCLGKAQLQLQLQVQHGRRQAQHRRPVHRGRQHVAHQKLLAQQIPRPSRARQPREGALRLETRLRSTLILVTPPAESL